MKYLLLLISLIGSSAVHGTQLCHSSEGIKELHYCIQGNCEVVPCNDYYFIEATKACKKVFNMQEELLICVYSYLTELSKLEGKHNIFNDF